MTDRFCFIHFMDLTCVEDTAIDAADGKWSSSSLGYYSDQYIGEFLEIKYSKPPHQNLGSYLRATFIYEATKHFFHINGHNSQVFVLGCGYDTLFWRLRDEDIHFNRWIEFDKLKVIQHKKEIIECNEKFSPRTGYEIHDCDFDDFSNFLNVYSLIECKDDIPSLYIDEFTLIYVNPNSYSSILKFIAQQKKSCYISYGMTSFNDQFGEMAIQSFNEIGIPLKSHSHMLSMKILIDNVLESGFSSAYGITAYDHLKLYLEHNEQNRIKRVETFENFNDVLEGLKHYYSLLAGSKEFASLLT